MSAQEENLDLEDLKEQEAGRKIISGVKRIYQSILGLVRTFNTLAIPADQLTLAQAESYTKTRARIKLNTLLSFEYFIMNGFATVIVCCGLATNSMLAIFGASALAMLLDPIMGNALAIVESDKKFFMQSLFSILVGAFIVLSVSFAFSIVYRYHITNLPESNLMKYAIPDLLDLVMAIACGAGCAYATLSRRIRVGLSGIMLSITLLPPLAACGIFLAHGSISLAAGAFVSYLTNFIAIQFVASAIFYLHGFMSNSEDCSSKINFVMIFKKNKVSLMGIVILGIILSINLGNILESLRFEQDVKVAVRQGLTKYPGADLAELFIDQNNVITAIVRSSNDISKSQVKRIADILPVRHGKQQKLHMRIIKVHEVSA